MRIYLAAPWAHREDMPTISEQLEAAGHYITWKWWETPDLKEGSIFDGELMKQAGKDMQGVIDADVLVVLNSAKSEGKAVEQGLAIAYKKPIIAVGKLGDGTAKNVFHYLPNYRWVETVDEASKILGVLDWVVASAR
jgi:nucleoside 2-deoxyribosyltransferase